MKKVLILNPYFYPGYRSGGPQQTVGNICDVFGSVCEIYILTQDHDFGVAEPYEGIRPGTWLEWHDAKVKYLPAKEYGLKAFRNAYKEFDTIYACGLFEKCTYQTLLLHKFAKDRKKLYVAPMGVFSEGAMSSKKTKKRLFLLICKALGLFHNVEWSFTSDMEYQDACHVIDAPQLEGHYMIAADLPRKVDFDEVERHMGRHRKKKGELRIVFLSRICAKKNLKQCANILSADYDGQIYFDIYGIKEDTAYWEECEQMLKALPDNVSYRYCGEVLPENVINVFGKYDVFLFPTKGENFGHVIYEAMAAGCIPIISDTTPWQDLDEKKCGNVIPINDRNFFIRKIQEWINTNNEQYIFYRRNAVIYAKEQYARSVESSGYTSIFHA